MTAPINRLLVVGLGLIGGSLALAARQKGLCKAVWGVSRSAATVDKALSLGVVDQCFDSLEDAARQLRSGDMVAICVPTLTVPTIIQTLQPLLDTDVTITDAASTKGSVVAAVAACYGEIPPQFVPGHPIAGSERSGVEAADRTLYRDHRVILTPLPQTGNRHLQRVRALWEGVGATVTQMPVAEHDEVLAATSHLPHLLAFALVDVLAGMRENEEVFRYAAGGFRDFTRIAASDPVMWHDIVLANATAIDGVLQQFSQRLEDLRQAMQKRDGDYLMTVFSRASEARNRFSSQLQPEQLTLERQAPEQLAPAHLTTGSSMDSDPMANIIHYESHPGGPLQGSARVPGDKSISHRAIMLGSLAEGTTRVSGFLEGEDSLATLQAFRAMGVQIEGPEQGEVIIHGVGLHGLQDPGKPLYLGNSGTSIRLLAGLLAGQTFTVELCGDKSLSGRPMGRVVAPLRQMGADIQAKTGEVPPLRIGGGRRLRGIDYQLPMASAQVKSCVLLAGLYAEGETSTTEPAPTRDHTERMLQGFGYAVTRTGSTTSLRGGGQLRGATLDIPADISSAAFFMVAAAITPGSDIELLHVGVNPTRTGVIAILQMMGADIDVRNARVSGGEPVADIRVRYAPLTGIEIPQQQVPLAIDEFPAIFVAAACAEGVTLLRGAAELRVKESDRIQAMADGLQILGVCAKALPDGIEITGGSIDGGEVDSLGDHRIAMAFAVAGLRAGQPVRIKNCNNVATSFPGFTRLANSLGMRVCETVERVEDDE